MKLAFLKMRWVLIAAATAALAFTAGCSSRDTFTTNSNSQAFAQSYNPENIDVLWVVDLRSPMYNAKEHLVSEATKFFTRLDEFPRDYRMGFISVDNEVSHGDLRLSLKKKEGTQAQRVQKVSDFLLNKINLSVGPSNMGLEAARIALLQNFKPRAGVPLVIVFVSYSDDVSPVSTGTAADYYADAYLATKNNDKNLLRVYSVNYKDAGNPTDANRCAQRYDNAIDEPGYEDRYFELAEKFGPSAQVTADLCGSFASTIDLTGLKLKELSKRFKLNTAVDPSTISVSVFRGAETFDIAWSYDAATQEIVFVTAPPEGSTISVTYKPL